MYFVPRPPYQPADTVFGYHADGMLGCHEHLKWPQKLYRPEIHSLAAPANPVLLAQEEGHLSSPGTQLSSPGTHILSPGTQPSSTASPRFADCEIPFLNLDRSQDFIATSSSGLRGTIRQALVSRLGRAKVEIRVLAEAYVKAVQESSAASRDAPAHLRKIAIDTFLFQRSRIVQLDRAFTMLLEYPMEWLDVLLWFREFQRLLLDLRAWIYYMAVVKPRLDNPSFHHPFPVLPIRGIITSDPSLVHEMFRVGIPVWHIRELDTFTTKSLINRVGTFVDPAVCFSSSRTIESGGKQIHAPLWTSGPGLKHLTLDELRALSHKFWLSNSPIFRASETYDPRLKAADSSILWGNIQSPGAPLVHRESEHMGTQSTSEDSPPVQSTLEEIDQQIISVTTYLQGMSLSQTPSHRSKGEIREGKGHGPPLWAKQSESISSIEAFMLANFRDDTSQALTYHLPPPHLFYAGDFSGPIIVQRVHNWLRIRDWCIEQGTRPCLPRFTRMTAHQWRTALEGRYHIVPYDPQTVHPKSSSEDIAKLAEAPHDMKRRRTNTSPDKFRTKAQPRLADRIDINVRFGVHAGFAIYSPVEKSPWGKMDLDAQGISTFGSPALVNEVVWELSVASFRLELMDIDRDILAPVYNHPDCSLAARRESHVCHVWQERCIRPMWTRDLACDALSSSSWDERIPAVKQLAYVISFWPAGQRFRAWNDSNAVDAEAFARFEYDVFLFYARTFSEVRGRRPVLPLLRPASLADRI
ncbi:hypothetical protein PsYK624_064100 [Phanerochaete sordida]|uniref:Uncharacterized protein n=1 Tax=Phanerochaete sordida TaxID=48140 RepID=A0A9P3LC96_9APHY|nr:hypothetical protein PsYK624_064100 [Phanerochaete sordida]